ncbi:TIR domain-containing protein [Luteolibacter yonseiensis]|uniref:TIR domain-containing protein n=1 Tax=Luteolibacter yonseiensis TaxID=1144680 RepID=A0A934R389_9BACT|nr:toll/interleukin-1 receptor domain-containing protein [Luteolibacter yonseiensis]MBK1816012.1 TIR domain-containing protein [Luteolibacter yonseiensis]
MSITPPPQPRRYAMFISYRHADNLEMGRKWATWLHESVENYDIPVDLVGKTNLRDEPVPATLYPVFRDEEELPADADLSNNIRRALENSSLLVVLCSPRAVQSRFVADEIRYFKEIGKSSRILALIIDGEPNASDDPEKIARLGAAAECFPEPLRFGVPDDKGVLDWSARTEPIAADCRPGGHSGQGWTTAAAYEIALEKQGMSRVERSAAVREYAERLELAKLKVIAGAIGMPLGELTRRDKVRQLQRARQRARVLTMLSSVFAVLAIAAGVLGWMANEKRKEATTQRQAAVKASALADARRVEADEQRSVAVTAQGEAETARNLADTEKRQAVATLATSDFQEGINRLSDSSTARAGLAYLARSARSGHESAAIRTWILFQHQPFWLPTENQETPPASYQKHLSSIEPPPAFQNVKLGAETLAPTWYAESADGKRCITVISNFIPGEGGHVSFRFWETTGKPIGAWHDVVYEGDYYLSGIVGATLSPDGRFAAIIASPWRMPQYVEVWDVDHGKKVGESIPADGAQPNYQGGAFNDVWFVSGGKRPGPLLVTLSNRGNASVHSLYTEEEGASMTPPLVHPHAQSVNVAAIDVDSGVFASAAADRSIRISRLFEEQIPAWPITAPSGIGGLKIDSPEKISALLDDGKTTGWTYSKPPTAPAPEQKSLVMNEASGFEEIRPSGENEAPPPPGDHRDKLELRVVNGSELQLIEAPPSGKVLWNHRFSAPIAFVRFLDGPKILVQTEFFTTEIWDTTQNALVHPVIDESPLFDGDTAADTTLLSSLSPDGRLALTRSFQWVPPNVGVYGFTLWDLASGKPLTGRRVSYNNIATDEVPESHAEFSSDGRFLLFGQYGKEVPKSVNAYLQLIPPAAVLPLIPDLAEALAGQKLQADGNLAPIHTDPATVRDAVLKAIAAP